MKKAEEQKNPEYKHHILRRYFFFFLDFSQVKKKKKNFKTFKTLLKRKHQIFQTVKPPLLLQLLHRLLHLLVEFVPLLTLLF